MTSLFASRRRWRGSEQWLLDKIVETFDAVDVTGLSGWERERRLVERGWYGEMTEGDSPRRDVGARSDAKEPLGSCPSAIPLFDLEDEAA